MSNPKRVNQWAFYTHIASGPVALVLGQVLLSERFRHRFLHWYKRLGQVQAMGVLFLVAPSGLFMSTRAQAGPIAGLGFAALAVATAVCVVMGWRSAVQRRFLDHRRWMYRFYLLLCSAVDIRLLGGLAVVTGLHTQWFYPLAAWACWLVPLIVFECRGEARPLINARVPLMDCHHRRLR